MKIETGWIPNNSSTFLLRNIVFCFLPTYFSKLWEKMEFLCGKCDRRVLHVPSSPPFHPAQLLAQFMAMFDWC